MSHEAGISGASASRKRRWPIVISIIAVLLVLQAVRAYIHVQEHGFSWPKWETIKSDHQLRCEAFARHSLPPVPENGCEIDGVGYLKEQLDRAHCPEAGKDISEDERTKIIDCWRKEDPDN